MLYLPTLILSSNRNLSYLVGNDQSLIISWSKLMKSIVQSLLHPVSPEDWDMAQVKAG